MHASHYDSYCTDFSMGTCTSTAFTVDPPHIHSHVDHAWDKFWTLLHYLGFWEDTVQTRSGWCKTQAPLCRISSHLQGTFLFHSGFFSLHLRHHAHTCQGFSLYPFCILHDSSPATGFHQTYLPALPSLLAGLIFTRMHTTLYLPRSLLPHTAIAVFIISPLHRSIFTCLHIHATVLVAAELYHSSAAHAAPSPRRDIEHAAL